MREPASRASMAASSVRDLGLGVAAVPGGVLVGLVAQAVEVGDRGVAQLVELGGVRRVLQGPVLLVGALLLGEAGHRDLVLDARPLEQLVGPGLCLRHPVPGVLLRHRDRLVAGLRGAGPQQRGLVGGVGEHDLDLGAGLLEPALGLLARRRHGGLQLRQLVGRLLGLTPQPARLRPGLAGLAVGIGAQLVGQALGPGEQGQRLVDGAHGRGTARVSRRPLERRPV